MTMLVKDVMVKNVITINTQTTLGEAVKIFVEKGIGCLPVVDENGALEAFLSDEDIVHYVISHFHLLETEGHYYKYHYPKEEGDNYLKMLLKNCVNDKAYLAARHHVKPAEPDESVRCVAEAMQKKHTKRLPVVENGKLVGIITGNCILHGLFTNGPTEKDAPAPTVSH